MATLEERITALERATAEYRPVLQSIAYELTMVKGIIIDQVSSTRELKQDVSQMKQDIGETKNQLTRIEEQLSTILTLLKPS